MGCTFCATGRLGLRRNLETWEIVEQVRTVRLKMLDDGVKGRVVRPASHVRTTLHFHPLSKLCLWTPALFRPSHRAFATPFNNARSTEWYFKGAPAPAAASRLPRAIPPNPFHLRPTSLPRLFFPGWESRSPTQTTSSRPSASSPTRRLHRCTRATSQFPPAASPWGSAGSLGRRPKSAWCVSLQSHLISPCAHCL